MDQISHGFRLCQVNAPVQESATSEFPWLGEPRSAFQHRVQHRLAWKNPPMTGDLHNVFTCKSSWRTHDRNQHFIYVLTLADNVAEMKGVSRRRRRLQRCFSHRKEAFVS